MKKTLKTKTLRTVGLCLLAVFPAPLRAGAEPGSTEREAQAEEIPTIVPRAVFGPGTRRIESGLRVERTKEGISVSEEVFPAGGEPLGLELPPHLGGGYLFTQPLAADGESATAMYRSDSWTGALRPLARLPFPVRHVEPGLDRLYAFGASMQAALDPHSGEVLPLSPLPPLVTVEGLAFDGPYRGLVAGPLVGVLYTQDAGVTWQPVVGAREVQVNLSGTELLVRTDEGVSLVSRGGSLETARGFSPSSVSLGQFLSGYRSRPRLPKAPGSSESEGHASSALEPAFSKEQGERQFETLLTRGVRQGNRAVALLDGKLLSLAWDARLKVEAKKTDVSAGDVCMGVEGAPVKGASVASPVLFVCEGEGQTVYSYAAPKKSSSRATLKPIWTASQRRPLLSWGRGGVLIEGACSARSRSEREGCWVREKGATTVHLSPPTKGARARESFAVSSTRTHQITVDLSKNRVKAQELGPGAVSKPPRFWKLPRDHAVSDFLRTGTLIRRASLLGNDLHLWATQNERLVGVLLGAGTEPSFGPVQRPLRRALLDGPRAMIWGAAGFAKQSTNGGQTFVELELPYQSGDPELSSVEGATAAVTMGCSSVGCVLGRFFRLGFRRPQSQEVAIPPPSKLLNDGAWKFQFSCGAGDVNTAVRSSQGSAPFPSFWEAEPPLLTGGQVGSSVGFPGGLLRLYAYGPQDADWARHGRVQAYFVDPWDPKVVYQTAATRQIFESALDAQEKMGLLDRTAATTSYALEPGGRAGVMVLGDRSAHQLLTFAAGEPLESFVVPADMDLRNLVGVVLSRGSLVAAFREGGQLLVVRLVGGQILEVARLPLGDSGERGVSLVRTNWGDLGVAMDGDDALFVYPLSEAGQVGDPIVVPRARTRPGACRSEAHGYLVEREMSIAPYLEVAATGAPLSITRPRVRFVVGYDPPCLDSLLGFGRTQANLPPMKTKGERVPFSVINTDADGNRLRLYCE